MHRIAPKTKNYLVKMLVVLRLKNSDLERNDGGLTPVVVMEVVRSS